LKAATDILIGDRPYPASLLMSQTSPTSVGADQTPWDIGYSSTVLATSSAAYSIGGFANPFPGRSFKIHNSGSYVLRIKHQDASTTAACRTICPYGLDWPLAPGMTFEFWYDATAQRYRLVNGWDRVLKDPQYGMEFLDDFITGSTAVTTSGIVNWGATVSGASASIQGNQNGNNNGYGFAKLNCQTVAHYSRLTSPFITRIRHGFMFETQLRVETLSTVAERANYLVGMATPAATTLTPADGIFFFYDKNVSDNIQCGTMASSSPTTVDSLVPVTTSHQVLRWVLNSAHSSVDFFIGDMATPVATITGTIPTAATALHPFALYLKALGSATFNSIYLDSWHMLRVDYAARY